MKTTLAELGLGVATALLSSLLVGGALLMSLIEGRPASAPPPAITETPPPAASTQTTARLSPTPVATLTCPTPLGWLTYTTQPGDSWEGLAAQFGVTVELLQERNCDLRAKLVPGWIVNIPPAPTETPSPTSTATPTATNTSAPAKHQSEPDTPEPTETAAPQGCSPPAGWVIYIVRPGDTLYQIGLRYNVVYTEIMRANCLTSEKIISGQRLYVPNVPPKLTATATSTSTNPPPPPTRTRTATSVPPTAVPPTSEPLPSDTAVPPTATTAPSDTAIPPTATTVPSDTPVPPTETPAT